MTLQTDLEIPTQVDELRKDLFRAYERIALLRKYLAVCVALLLLFAASAVPIVLMLDDANDRLGRGANERREFQCKIERKFHLSLDSC